MSAGEGVGGTVLGLVVTWAWDKYMKSGYQVDPSETDKKSMMSTALTPVSVEVVNLIKTQQSVINAFKKQLANNDVEEDIKVRNTNVEKMMKLAEESAKPVHQQITQVTTDSAKLDVKPVVKQAVTLKSSEDEKLIEVSPAQAQDVEMKEDEHKFTKFEDATNITVPGGDILKTNNQLTIVLLPVTAS